MLRFFSKIRYQFAAKNKVASYFRYAIGEILLVVVGILIALQVNNWNEQQKLKASERLVLKSLLKEFEYNQEILEKTITINKNNLIAAQELGKYTGPHLQQTDEKKLSQLMVGTFKYMVNYLPSLGTLFDIINSGKLSLISNQGLRSNLAAFEAEMDNVHRQENDVKREQNVAHDILYNKWKF